MTNTPHIIAVDIGNTHAGFAVMDGLVPVAEFEVSSHGHADTLHELLQQRIPEALRSRPLVIASVNPRFTEVLEAQWHALTGQYCTVLGRDLHVPIPNLTNPPEKTGQDRLVNALAAKARRGDNAIVVDFGTAITFDVLRDGAYAGGVITPGIGLAMEALHQKTALLPLVRPQGRPAIIGTDTVSAINAGVFYGYIGLVENILRELLHQFTQPPPVLATGGYGAHLAPEIPLIDESIAQLTHEGIALAWQSASR